MSLLLEHNTFDDAQIELMEDSKLDSNGKKKMCMKGIFLQADVRNHNKRVYPLYEIKTAVDTLNEKIKKFGPVPGECAHPDGLEINIDRISHSISEMWMDGKNGMGKLTLLPTPLGNVIRTLLENDVKLGVSSRGSGDVNDFGEVKGFQIITVDVVSTPSAPEAYPTTIYEQLMYAKNSSEILKLAEAVNYDNSAQRYFQGEIISWMDKNFIVRRK
jgi:hypothetical protein